MDDTKAIEEIWRRTGDGNDVFANAVLKKDCVMKGRTARAGTKVLITMASRFGDFGIRDKDVDKPEHGYYARVMPEDLENIVFIPNAEGTPWRKQMREKYEALKKK